MRAVDLKELKNQLSEFVRIAASGEPVLVIDRGRVVAELTGPRPGRATWADLIRRSVITPAIDKSGLPPPKPPPIMTRDELLEELARDREDR